MELPRYTSSTLYRVFSPPLGRGFIPASTRPRWVVGMRVYCGEELVRDPFQFEVVPKFAANLEGYLTLIDAFTAQPIVRGYPLMALSQFATRQQTKAVAPLANGTTNPLVRPLAMPRRCNVGGSWIRNPNAAKGIYNWVEIFYCDEEGE